MILKPVMYLTGYQIKLLASMTDGDDECELGVSQYPESTDEETGETMPAGLYAFYADYLDEGRTFLPAEAEKEEMK